jgi:hypothetical protein
MPVEITAAEAGANILAHVAEKRLVQCKGEWRPRQNWLDRVSLFEAIHLDIKGSSDCPPSLMPRWLAGCTIELFDGIAKTDIYVLAERYGKLLATGAMAKADDWLRDRWLVFVTTEALVSARQIAITKKPYWRMTEASCELAVAALVGKESRDVATDAAKAAQRAAQSAASEAGYRIAIGEAAGPIVRAKAEEQSAKAATAAAEAAEAAAGASQAGLAAICYLPQWAAKKAAEAACQAAQGWIVAAGAIDTRDLAMAEAAGAAALDACFKEVTQRAHSAMVSAKIDESFSPENSYRRMFDRLLDEIDATKPSSLRVGLYQGDKQC